MTDSGVPGEKPGDVARCPQCGRQSRSYSRGCSDCGFGVAPSLGRCGSCDDARGRYEQGAGGGDYLWIPCPDCEARQAAGDLEVVRMSRVGEETRRRFAEISKGLPVAELSGGTEGQVAWATDVRMAQVVRVADIWALDVGPDDAREAALMIGALLGVSDASWWLERRDFGEVLMYRAAAKLLRAAGDE